ncbi:hypothetical protein HDU67_007907, partial [Dinochytrium kinnereticum]
MEFWMLRGSILIPNLACTGPPVTKVPTANAKLQSVIPPSSLIVIPPIDATDVGDGSRIQISEPPSPTGNGGSGQKGLSAQSITGIVGGVSAVVIISVLAAMIFVNRIRRKPSKSVIESTTGKHTKDDPESPNALRLMPWGDSANATLMSSASPALSAVNSRKPSVTMSELELPELVSLSPTFTPSFRERTSLNDLKEASPAVDFSAGFEKLTSQEQLERTPTLPIIVTDENGLDILSNGSTKLVIRDLPSPENIIRGEESTVEGWTPQMTWEWEQYQWACQWHEWQMQQREWQMQVRQKYLEKEAKRLSSGGEAKDPVMIKVKPPRVYKPSPLARPISMSTISSSSSRATSNRDSLLSIDGPFQSLTRGES